MHYIPTLPIVSDRHEFGGTIFATGWDQASAIMKVFTTADETWTTYRLPKASHCFDHKWQTEWPRIREVEHERLLMDHHGMFYELSPWAYGGRIWGVRPISTHLSALADFCLWRGMLVLGGDNASPSGGHSPTTAEPQSGRWFGKTDDLWGFGKPTGWGGPWWLSSVAANEPSDPYLMTGFEHKSRTSKTKAASPPTSRYRSTSTATAASAPTRPSLCGWRHRQPHIPHRVQRPLGAPGQRRRHTASAQLFYT